MRALGPDGLSRFQHRVESALATAGFNLRGREVKQLSGGAPEDLYVTGTVSGHRVFLYQDGIELQVGPESLRLEDWDTRRPEDMIDRLLERLAKLHGGAA